MMKRPVEKQMMFPHMEVLFAPASEFPVSVVIEQDWGMTGEVHVSEAETQRYRDLIRCLEHITNHLADIVVFREKIEALQKKE